MAPADEVPGRSALALAIESGRTRPRPILVSIHPHPDLFFGEGPSIETTARVAVDDDALPLDDGVLETFGEWDTEDVVGRVGEHRTAAPAGPGAGFDCVVGGQERGTNPSSSSRGRPMWNPWA